MHLSCCCTNSRCWLGSAAGTDAVGSIWHLVSALSGSMLVVFQPKACSYFRTCRWTKWSWRTFSCSTWSLAACLASSWKWGCNRWPWGNRSSTVVRDQRFPLGPGWSIGRLRQHSPDLAPWNSSVFASQRMHCSLYWPMGDRLAVAWSNVVSDRLVAVRWATVRFLLTTMPVTHTFHFGFFCTTSWCCHRRTASNHTVRHKVKRPYSTSPPPRPNNSFLQSTRVLRMPGCHNRSLASYPYHPLAWRTSQSQLVSNIGYRQVADFRVSNHDAHSLSSVYMPVRRLSAGRRILLQFH